MSMFEKGEEDGQEWAELAEVEDVVPVVEGKEDPFDTDAEIDISPDDPEADEYRRGFRAGAASTLPDLLENADTHEGCLLSIEWAQNAPPEEIRSVLEGSKDILTCTKELSRVLQSPHIRREAAMDPLTELLRMARTGKYHAVGLLDPEDAKVLAGKLAPIAAEVSERLLEQSDWGLTPPRQPIPERLQKHVSPLPQIGRESVVCTDFTLGVDETVAVCFGLITLPGGQTKRHSWVELEGRLVFEPAAQALYKSDEFANFYKPSKVRRYEKELALYIGGRSGVHGPWTAKQVLKGVKAYEENTGLPAFRKTP